MNITQVDADPCPSPALGCLARGPGRGCYRAAELNGAGDPSKDAPHVFPRADPSAPISCALWHKQK
eukprot:4370327-Pyramimonas_sp.AAC.1